MYVYHYHATWPCPKASGVTHADGLIVREKMIGQNWDEYQELKRDICGADISEGVIIRSLTLVGQFDDAAREEQ